MRHGAAIPRPPLAHVGSEVGSPTPLSGPARSSSVLLLSKPPRSPLSRARRVLCVSIRHPRRTRPCRRRRVSVARRRRDASLRYVGRSSETAGQQDLMTRDRFCLLARSLARSHLETLRESLKTNRRANATRFFFRFSSTRLRACLSPRLEF